MSANTPAQDIPLLEVRGLRKSYGFRQILRGAALTLHTGECVVLCGENGVGKSTLLRILAGLSQAEAGSILWRGRKLGDRDLYVRSQIGYLGHDPILHGARSLTQHLKFAAQLHGLIEADRRACSLIQSAGLGSSSSRPVQEFSRGMQQRGALCRIWLPDPRLLLLDEPGSHLDEEGLAFLESLLAQRQAADQAILLVTHRQELAARWADRILYLRQGTVHQSAA